MVILSTVGCEHYFTSINNFMIFLVIFKHCHSGEKEDPPDKTDSFYQVHCQAHQVQVNMYNTLCSWLFGCIFWSF